MKEQLYKYYKNKGYDITLNDIKIDNRLTTKDERLGWEDTKMVCLNINGTSKCIGYCATKHQNLEKTINKLKIEKMENDLLSYLNLVITNMGCKNEFYFGEYAEQKVCLFKRNNLWEVYIAERGNIFDKSVHEELFDACIKVIEHLSESKEIFEKNKETFSKYSSLTYKNVPQPQGKVFRSNFDVKIFLQEKKIEELQQEYDRFINKINELNDNIQPLKLKNHDILNEYGKIEIELNKVNKEIENIEKDFSILKNKYREEIKKKEFKLLKKILITGAVAFVFGTILPHLINSLSFLINSPIIPIIYFVYSSLMILSHITQRDKYLSKLEKEYMQTEDYQNYQKQLDEKTKTKEQIEQKLDLKGKELEESRKEINIIKYQIDILIRNIKRIKEELIELILPDSKNIETKYQIGGALTQEETETSENNLVKRLTP